MLSKAEVYPMYKACKDSKDQGGFHDFVEILKLYDKNDDNTMIGNELFRLLTNLGEKLTKEEAKSLMKELCEPEDDDGFMPFIRKFLFQNIVRFYIDFFQHFWRECALQKSKLIKMFDDKNMGKWEKEEAWIAQELMKGNAIKCLIPSMFYDILMCFMIISIFMTNICNNSNSDSV